MGISRGGWGVTTDLHERSAKYAARGVESEAPTGVLRIAGGGEGYSGGETVAVNYNARHRQAHERRTNARADPSRPPLFSVRRMSIGAAVFHAAFEQAFSPGAAASGLARSRARALKWTKQAPDGNTLTIGFRLNRKNLAGYPGEFMPDVFWSGSRMSTRDNGEVSYYQYTLPPESDAVMALQRSIIERFAAATPRQDMLPHEKLLVQLFVDSCALPILPNHHRWLPYWDADDARAWGNLFGASIPSWLSRFLANPETLDAWCRRVLWARP